MKNVILFLILAALAIGIAIPQYGYASQNSSTTATLGTAFTYQGRLTQSDSPATGSFDFRFILYDASLGGAQVGPVVTSNDLPVNDGYFVALLDFGESAFNDQARWLEISVRPGASNDAYTTLSPRQALTATPNALYSQTAPWSGLSGVPSGFADGVDNDTLYSPGTGLRLTGTSFSADTSYLQRRVSSGCATGSAIRTINTDGTVVCETDDNTTNFWSLTGNSGTSTATNYIGTNDDTALILRVNGQPALWLVPDPNGPNVVGGYGINWLAGGVYAATLFGGGYYNGSGMSNAVFDIGGTVSGGIDNEAGLSDANPANAEFATVSGGYYNRANGPYSTIGGGGGNNVVGQYASIGGGLNNNAEYYGTVAGGQGNIVHSYGTAAGGYYNNATGSYAAVGGGESNTASGSYATIGGGNENLANAIKATIGGGSYNLADGHAASIGGGGFNTASGNYPTVGGGSENTANVYFSTVGGGYSNLAGPYSTVGGGSGNTANADYATVGGGYNNLAIGSTSTIGGGTDNNTLINTATIGGGDGNIVGVNGASGTIGGGWMNFVNGNTATVPGGAENEATAAYSFAAGAQGHATHAGSFVWSSGEHTYSYADRTFTVRSHGGARFYTASGTGTGVVLAAGGGSWSNLSDRNAKENFQSVDAQAVLAQVAQLPIASWNYRSQDDTIRHLGPIAQDFSRLFALGEDDTHITTVDADGVALVAIQGLYSQSQEQAAQITALTAENTALKAQISDIEARLASLEHGTGVAAALPSIWSYLPSFGLGAIVFGGVLAWLRKGGGL